MTPLPQARPVVTRCVCRDVSFARLLAMRDGEGLRFEDLRERTGCCTACAMCEPYVRLTLATGRAAHGPLTGEQTRRAMALEV